MLKRKKVFIMTVVLVLLLAMATTGYATMNSCYLSLGETGSESTAPVTTTHARSTGYNSQYSSRSMLLKMQWYVAGDWKRVNSWYLPVDYWGFNSGLVNVPQSLSFRTKIYSDYGDIEAGAYIKDY